MTSDEKFVQDLIEYWKKLENDFKYQNEIQPARRFFNNFEKYFGVAFKSLKTNENDPPDFFLVINDDKEINLEVTTFDEKRLSKHNSFFNTLESLVEPLIEKNLQLLPKGSYLIFYTPGSQDASEFEKIRIEIPDFKYKISRNDLEKFLIENIPRFFKQFKDKSNNTLHIVNKDNNQIGKLHLSRMVEAEETNYLLFHQKYVRFENWERDEFFVKLQETINKKEEKYLRNEEILKQNNYPWWLLISDLHGRMGTCRVK